jgi:hypothetical protein
MPEVVVNFLEIMSTQSNKTFSDLSFSEPAHSAINGAEFDMWASEVRRQMVASLRKRAAIDGSVADKSEEQDLNLELADGEESEE